jgi:hypothetical protein
MSDECFQERKLVPPFWLCVGSFVTEETTPIMDIKTEGLVSDRAVYGHCERESSTSDIVSWRKTYAIDYHTRSHTQRWVISYWF